MNKHASVFSKSDDDFGYMETVKHKIRTEDDIPVTQPYRRIPPNQYQEVKEHIQKLLDSSVIRESHSPYASPIVLVRKKNGSLRLCVDYRKLNLRTQKDSFPLPRIDESLDALNAAQWFTTLDLADLQAVLIRSQSKRKTNQKPHSLLCLDCLNIIECRLASVVTPQHFSDDAKMLSRPDLSTVVGLPR